MTTYSLFAAGMLAAALTSVQTAEAGSRFFLDDGIPGGHDGYYEPSFSSSFDRGGYRDQPTVYSPRRSSCNPARVSVRDEGYETIRTIECRGPNFTFHAKREGRWWKVKVRARNGRIRQVYPL